MARQMKDSGIEWIGEIPEKWSLRRLRFLCDISTGNQDTQDNDPDGEYPFYVRSPIVEKSRRYTFEGPAILMAGDGVGAGKVFHYVDGKYGCHQRVYSMQHIHDIHRRFLFYYLQNRFVISIETANSKSTVDSVRLPMLQDFPVTIPSPAEQHLIAAFLDRKCAEIDAVFERTKSTIEEYKKLKQAVITEAVTKGVRGPRPMKDSGIEWIGEIPEGWTTAILKYSIRWKSEKGQPDATVLSLYRDYGVVPKDSRDDNHNVTSLDTSTYKVVSVGDFVINKMKAWQGSMAVSDYAGIVSPAYHVCEITNPTLNKRYLHHLLRNHLYIPEYTRLSTGMRIGQWDLGFDDFKNLPFIIPPIDEQAEIVEYIENGLSQYDTLIAKKTALLTELETYKKSLIYEYVTGKTEAVDVQAQEHAPIVYPSFPAVINTDKPRFAQAILMSKILDSNVKQMGRVKLEKMLYTIETSIGFDFDTEYAREAAGPLHSSIYECEGIIGQRNKWFTLKQSQHGVSYTPTSSKDKYKKYYDKYFGDYDAEIDRIISVFRDYTMDQAEIIATLFAAWNDAIIDQKQFTDEDIVDDVLNNWHESKTRFPRDVWLRAMEQMRKNGLVPKGYGKHTVIKKMEV